MVGAATCSEGGLRSPKPLLQAGPKPRDILLLAGPSEILSRCRDGLEKPCRASSTPSHDAGCTVS